MNKIIILCPGDVISGGVNSLHNLCASLVRNGFIAAMYYFNAKPEILNSYQIKSYNVNRFNGKIDEPDQIIIVPETMIEILTTFSKAKKIIYWLALNYYFKNPPWRSPFHLKAFRKLISCRSYYGYSGELLEKGKRKLNEFSKSKFNIWTDDFIHISNSNFVANYCRHKGANETFVLFNPIRDEFYLKKNDINLRKNIILFGPKTHKLLVFFARVFLKGYRIIQLRHIPFQKVYQLMSESLIFAEFGNNPGRDRMPREATMLGCIVFMNTRGSSALKEDYNIYNHYKIVDKLLNYPVIIKRIKKAAKNYKTQISDFNQFREQLKNEKVIFDREVKNIFSKLLDGV